ncbi:MAG: hypothetical protein GEU97_18555 [Actinophytocola sp.]|nr:hypothetical protein [Actinophytocola sp.]
MSDGAHRRRVRSPDPTLGRSRPSMRPVRRATVERVPGTPSHLKGDLDQPTKPKRQRVVLGGPEGMPVPSLRSRMELAEQTSWGEMLIRDLINALLRWSTAFALITLVLLGGLPLLFWQQPDIASFTVVGVPIAWLILGVFVSPVLFALGVMYERLSERHEREFVDMIEN